MPKVKTATVTVRHLEKGYVTTNFTINVNVHGDFYCRVPADAEPYFEKRGELYHEGRVRLDTDRAGRPAIYSKDMTALEGCVSDALAACYEPKVEVEHVIRFNIESHVAFWVDDDGQIKPNGYAASREGAWNNEPEKYGNHHATSPAKGGYSLTVGAQALIKTTRTYGDAKKVDFKKYYKGKSHLGFDNPAQMLNSWVSYSLPERAREIPYTDEAAMFFYNLMLGMAELSRRVQDATFEIDNLNRLIEAGATPMLPKPKE